MGDAFTAPPWLASWLQSINVWDALLFIAGVVLLVLFIKKQGWRTVVAMARGIINATQILEAVQDLPEFIDRSDKRHGELAAKVQEIHHETHTNNGSSIKDSTGRIEKSLEGLHGRVDDVQRELANTTTLAAENRERIAALEGARKEES